MTQEENDTDKFFTQLLGKPPSDGAETRPGLEELRNALQAQIETCRTAENARAQDLDPSELAHMAEIKQLLIERGLLGKPDAESSLSGKSLSRFLQRIKETMTGDSWYRPVALAVVLLLGISIVIKLALPPGPDETTVRGVATPVLVVSDPVAVSAALSAKLQKAGADVINVPINDTEWSMRVDVPGKIDAATIQKILKDSGVPVTGLPPYHIRVKRKR